MEAKPYIDDGLVLLDVAVEDKWALIDLMVSAMAETPVLLDQPEMPRERVLEAVVNREKEKATGLGNGFAFPHGRIRGFQGAVMAVALPAKPVDFGALDGKPAELVCLLVVPEDQPQAALKVMSQFARLVSDPVDRQILFSLSDSNLLSTFLGRRVLGVDAPVLARDIMRKPLADIYTDTPLKEVTRTMLRHRLDSIAVIDHDGTLKGEITCEALFKLGMPDFFTQLKSIAFISEFDPFEKYFEGESERLARDVMSQDYAAVPDDATLLEIVFELAVHRHSKVHVVHHGKRIGAIDRILVLDRVINI